MQLRRIRHSRAAGQCLQTPRRCRSFGEGTEHLQGDDVRYEPLRVPLRSVVDSAFNNSCILLYFISYFT